MKRSSMSCSLHQSVNVWLVSSGPLSQRIALRPAVQVDHLGQEGDDPRGGNADRHVDAQGTTIGFVDHVQGPEDRPL